ncbi:MAG: recombination mediator RecR [Patescibacteria group bacterium]|nr:recombination mediator RecR [Patescibacteria group bacterium]
MFPPSIQKLIDLFSKFPSVGRRTAARFVFYIIKLPKNELEDFLNSVVELRKTIKICSYCFNPFDSSTSSGETLCPICRDPSRNKTLLCIVEKEMDLLTIEKTNKYKGIYFVLGGVMNLKKEGKNIRIDELKQRIKSSNFKEIIIAINPTVEGEITTLFIERELKPFNIKTTRLGRGLPFGGELEYADEETLESAFQGRK